MPYKYSDKHRLTVHEKREIMAICGDFKKRALEIERGGRREKEQSITKYCSKGNRNLRIRNIRY